MSMVKLKGRRGAMPPDINVTPFVDILLVLLIIFMVASPAIVSGLNINLPKGVANHDVMVNDKNVTITIDKSNNLYVNDKPITGTLLDTIKTETKGNQEAILFLRGDRVLQYGTVMNTINSLAKNGYVKIVLVTEDEGR